MNFTSLFVPSLLQYALLCWWMTELAKQGHGALQYGQCCCCCCSGMKDIKVKHVSPGIFIIKFPSFESSLLAFCSYILSRVSVNVDPSLPLQWLPSTLKPDIHPLYVSCTLSYGIHRDRLSRNNPINQIPITILCRLD